MLFFFSFLNKHNNHFSIGNRFELTILKAKIDDTGWYRCVQKLSNSPKFISTMYFLDVINSSVIKIVGFFYLYLHILR